MARYSTNLAQDECEAKISRPNGRTRVAVSRLADLNDRLDRALSAGRSLADRLLGSRPEPMPDLKPGPQPVANGSLDELHELISRAEDAAGALLAVIDRLNEAD